MGLSGADCRLSGATVEGSCLLLVSGCRLSGVGFWLTVPGVAQLFRCRCSAVGINDDLCFSFANYFYLFCMIPFLIPLLPEK